MMRQRGGSSMSTTTTTTGGRGVSDFRVRTWREGRRTYDEYFKGEGRSLDKVGGDPPGDDPEPDDDGDNGITFWKERDKPMPRNVDKKKGCANLAQVIIDQWNEKTENSTYIAEGNVVWLMEMLSAYLADCPPWAYGKKRKSSDEFKSVRGKKVAFSVDEEGRYRLPVQREVLGEGLRGILTSIQERGFNDTLSEFAMRAQRSPSFTRTSEKGRTYTHGSHWAQHMVATLAYEGYSKQDSMQTREQWTKASIDMKRYLDVRTSVLWLVQPSQWRNKEQTSFSPLLYAIGSYDTGYANQKRCFRELLRIGLENRTDKLGFSPLQRVTRGWLDTNSNRSLMHDLIGNGANLNYRFGAGQNTPIGYAILGGKVQMASVLAMYGANPNTVEKTVSLQERLLPTREKTIKVRTAYTVAQGDYDRWLKEQQGRSQERKRTTAFVEPKRKRKSVRSTRKEEGGAQAASSSSSSSRKRTQDEERDERAKRRGSIREQVAIRSYFYAHESGDTRKAARLLAERIPSRYHKHIQFAHKLFPTS